MHIVQENAFSQLISYENTNEKRTDEPPSEEDIKTGYEIFHAVVFCPPTMVFKLLRFLDQLLSSETSRTVIQTFVNLFQSGTITDDETSFTLAKQFYKVLAKTFQLQYGNVLLATSTRSQLMAVLDNDWPFFTNNTDRVKTCLFDSDCEGLQGIVQKIGIEFSVAINVPCKTKPFQMAMECHKLCPSTQST